MTGCDDTAIDKILRQQAEDIAKSKYGFDTSVKEFNVMSKEERSKVKCIKVSYNELMNPKGNFKKWMLKENEEEMK